MTLKEIEDKINENIREKGYYTSYYDLQDEIDKVMGLERNITKSFQGTSSIVIDNDYFTMKGKRKRIKSNYSENNKMVYVSVIIDVKKETIDKNSHIIDIMNKIKKDDSDKSIAYDKNKTEKLKEFKGKLSLNGISVAEFLEMKNIFEKLTYSQRYELKRS